jgi:hypothetical protein
MRPQCLVQTISTELSSTKTLLARTTAPSGARICITDIGFAGTNQRKRLVLTVDLRKHITTRRSCETHAISVTFCPAVREAG